MKVTVKRKEKAEILSIQTEFIKLQDAMKLANVVMSGGEAKVLIQDGQVLGNGETCLMRGKKPRPGDTFSFGNVNYRIQA